MRIRPHYITLLLFFIPYPFFTKAQVFPDLKFFPVHSSSPWPTKSITSQAADYRGLMWFSTPSSGLLRYDGNTIKQCISPDSVPATMHEISIDKNNILYISTGDGLMRYNPLTEETRLYHHNENDLTSLSDDDKPHPFVDSRNRVWVTSLGLQELQSSTGKFLTYAMPKLPAHLPQGEFNRLEHIAEDKEGNIWISGAYGLYKADTIHRKLIPYYSGKYSSVTSVLIDSKQQYWISTWGSGIMKFDPATGTYTRFFEDDTNNDIVSNLFEYHDIDGKRWIGFTDFHSVILANPETGGYKHYMQNNLELSLPDGDINYVYTDEEQRIWLCTDEGMFIVDNAQQQVRLYPLFKQSHRSEKEYGHPRFWFEHNNEIWLSLNFANGVAKYTKDLSLLSHQLKVPSWSTSNFSKVVNCIIEDQHHAIWYCTDSGLVKQTGNQYAVFLPENSFNIDNGSTFRSIIVRPDGKWWIRSTEQGMFVFDPNKEHFVKRYLPPGNAALYGAKLDNAGRLWIATTSGLFLLDEKTGAYTQFRLHYPGRAQDKLLNYLLDILIDDDNRIWLATYSGMAVFDIQKKQFAYPLPDQGTGNSPSFRILQDNRKIIWVVASEKLVAYNPITGKAKAFKTDIGLPAGFDAVGVFKQLKDANIWLAYPGGLCSFNPAKLLSSNTGNTCKVFITDVYEDNKRLINQQRQINIHSDVSTIRISFAYTNYSIAEQNILSFALHGSAQNASWQKTNGDINLVNLSPGKYILELKGENGTLNIPAVTSIYTLIVAPKWYQTLLFKIAIIMLTSAIVFVLIRLYAKDIESKAAVKQKIAETEMAALKAQMNPHFMFNCINSIDAFIYSNDKYNATLYLNKFAKLLRNILDNSKANTVYVGKDIETLKLYLELEELRHEGRFVTIFNIDEDVENSDLRVPPLVIQPFVENAILHGLKNKSGSDGELFIAIKKTNDHIQYIIRDNGIGRDAAANIAGNKTSSYGMAMSIERIRLFNKEEKASVEIADHIKNGAIAGTIVKVWLKTAFSGNEPA